MKQLAIFDIDGTIFRSSLTIELLESLIEEGVFPQEAGRVYARAARAWLDRKGSYDEYVQGTIKAFDTYLKGVPKARVLRIARNVVAFQKDRVYRYTRDLLIRLKKQGYYLVAISHSSATVAHDFGKRMGFDKVYGRLHEVDAHGRFTGKHLFVDTIDDKANLVKHLMENRGYSLKGSIGVGDTESDIRFLEMVEQPICFNPNLKLYRHAKQKRWTVVVERKDVIYVMNKGRSSTR